MGILIKSEIRKMLLKPSIIITWIVLLLFSKILIRPGESVEVWADVFSKISGIVPLIGLITFMIISAVYTLEYSSNMNELINTTQNGKKKVVMAKSIGAGIATSIGNLSIVLTVCIDGLIKSNFKGLDLPLKKVWYFGNSGTNITVLQMMIILIITVIIGSFFFSQLGLYLSAISKSASIPFVFGGLLMGVPYILSGLLSQGVYAKYFGVNPLWGMMSMELIKYQVPISLIMIQIAIVIACFIFLPKLTYKSFIKE
ncbi:hypothetical protein G9F73_001755 [Clostridium estertheticum]|uniref:hypothetical protein n=1 Tax=Clostridium estertheticum TaxID=238834 RepID=UPI0013EECE60|nr:hypothetical protein [Clostridium estertheticum]MBZ9606562.1 hypothetical protein [Clostridium estertheticum]